MMGNGWSMGTGWMWLFWPLLIGGVVLLVIVLTRAVGGGVTGPERLTSPRRSTGGSRAEQILEERYAAGELTTEEYQERLRTLRGGGR